MTQAVDAHLDPGVPQQWSAAPAAGGRTHRRDRTTALRLIQDLVNGGLARRNEDGTFRLATGWPAPPRQHWTVRSAHDRPPTYGELCEELGVTVHIATVVNGSIVYATRSNRTARCGCTPDRQTREGSRLGCRSSRAAFMPAPERRAVLSDFTFERFNAATIVGHQAFAAELAGMRRNGHPPTTAHTSFVNCIGYPVPTRRDGCVPRSRHRDQGRPRLAALRAGLPQIRRTGEAIAADWVGSDEHGDRRTVR